MTILKFKDLSTAHLTDGDVDLLDNTDLPITVMKYVDVRIPLGPPLALTKAFFRSGCGRIFPLFAGVMRVGLSTGSAVRWAGSVLSRPIFSGPHDCVVLVNFRQGFEIALVNHVGQLNVSFSGTRFEKEQKSNFRQLGIEVN